MASIRAFETAGVHCSTSESTLADGYNRLFQGDLGIFAETRFLSQHRPKVLAATLILWEFNLPKARAHIRHKHDSR